MTRRKSSLFLYRTQVLKTEGTVFPNEGMDVLGDSRERYRCPWPEIRKYGPLSEQSDCRIRCHALWEKHSHAMYARDMFWGGWITWNIVRNDYIFTKEKKSINAEKNENVELSHRYFVVDFVCYANNCNQNKLYWSHRYLLVQNSDCRPDTKCRL